MDKDKKYIRLFFTCKLLFLFLCFICNFYISSCEFLYPVAAIEQNGKIEIYVLHQKSINNLELWLWDPETKVCSKDLLSSYMPASLKILPSGDGFSFIDDGRIRIKKFNKRSPKSIDIYEPVYDISQVNWIDEHNFYVSAKKNNKFCIFHVHETGLIKPILENINFDFMYPQKVGNNLFYIERVLKDGQYKKEHVSYKIAKTVYPDLSLKAEQLNSKIENSDDFDFKTKAIQEFNDNRDTQNFIEKNCEYLVDFKDKPIAFLSMICETEGFFLQHQDMICKHDEVVVFDYFSLKLVNKIWVYKKIFSFYIPADLILEVPDSCLYESILPLLPKYYNNKIYFVDFDIIAQSLNIYSYNLCDNTIEKKLFFQDLQALQLLFSPIFLAKYAFCGGRIDYTKHCPIKMWIGQGGSICMDLPKIFY